MASIPTRIQLLSLKTAAARINISQLRSASSSSLSTPTDDDKEELFRRLGNRQNSVLTEGDKGQLNKYNNDWMNHYQGKSSIVVRPQSAQEVSSVLQYCNSRKLGVVPQGGNTGLVGGSVPVNDEVVLSLEKMNGIHKLDPMTGILHCDAGCILQNLQDYAAEHDHLVPVDLGAKGTCQIGGNISTNAGGSFYYRYGSLHANVVGLEVVLANGDILNLGCEPALLKDNTGYDLKHLFVGAEGTLGIVTKVALLCPRLPQSRSTALLACDSFDHVMDTLKLAKTSLGEVLAAFEFMDDPVINLVSRVNPGAIAPLPSLGHPYYILVETHGSSQENDQLKLEAFVEQSFHQNYVVDGIMASSLQQIEDIWKLRESCNPSVAASGYAYKYDVSLPIAEFPLFVEELKNALASQSSGLEFVNWGHVVDGNLHCNIVSVGNFDLDENLLKVIEGHVFEGVQKRGGSISAEHGLGQYKHKYLSQIHPPETLSKMRDIKKLFDPNGILNPGKYLPTAEL